MFLPDPMMFDMRWNFKATPFEWWGLSDVKSSFGNR
jgi:hypothetical protein